MLRTVAVILLAFPLRATAQIIRGTVIDAATNARIAAVNLTLLGGSGERFYTLVTNQDGTFELIIPAGRAVYVEAERIGYEGVKSTPLTARRGELIEIEVRLSPQAIPLNPVDVVARRPVDVRLHDFLDRSARYKKSGIGRIWTRADLEKRPFTLVSHLIRMIPVRPNLYCTGTTLYVDNVRLSIGDENVAPDDIDMLVSSEDLEGIEMYRDTDLPADLRSYARRVDGSSFCMVILAWRKPYTELYAGRRHPWWHGVLVMGAAVGIAAVERLFW